MPEHILQRIEELREELHQHNYNYYVLDEPTISDFEFDAKLKELQELEAAHIQSFMTPFSYTFESRWRNHQKFPYHSASVQNVFFG